MKISKNLFKITNLLVISVLFVLISCGKNKDNDPVDGSNVIDNDGNVYHTITIGTQKWLVENLKTTTYNDGSPIICITETDAWKSTTSGAFCNYNNNNNYVSTYGRLYNWYAVNSGKLAPKGWHVATDTEWGNLVGFLGGMTMAGGKLKERGTDHWYSPNSGATNESGFTALPGGNRLSNDGTFGGIRLTNYFWTNSISSSGLPMIWVLYNSGCYIYEGYTEKPVGCSVRCIKD